MEKEIFTLIGIILMLATYGTYIYSIFKGDTRPHPFSWFVWGLSTSIIFFAQISDNAGIGASITFLSALITFFIATIGYVKRKNIVISTSDKWAFFISIMTIPLWVITDTPLWSVILITIIDAFAFYPTFRKSWDQPYQESMLSFSISQFKLIFSILALEHYSIITTLFPLSLIFTNTALIIMVFYRKRKIPKSIR